MKKKYLSVKKISVKVLSAVLAASMSIGNAGAMKPASEVISEEVIPDSQNSSPISSSSGSQSSSSGSQSSSPTTPPLKPINHSELLARLRASYSEDDSEWLADLDAEEKAEQQIQELFDEARGNFDRVKILWALVDSISFGLDPDAVRKELIDAKGKDPEYFSSAKKFCDDYSDIFGDVFVEYKKMLVDSVGARLISNKTVTYDV